MSIKKFLDIEQRISEGTQSTIDLNQSSHNLVSHYIRAWRGRADLANLIQTTNVSQDFLTKLNEVRSMLRADELEQAIKLIDSLQTSHVLERVELELERCRYHLFRKEYLKVLALSGVLLQMPETVLQTKMTLYQIRGIARTYAGQALAALNELNMAISIAQSLPEAPSAFASYTVKAQAYACLNEKKLSKESLDLAKDQLDATTQDEIWIERFVNYLRACVRFDLYFESREKFLRTTMLTQIIAQWLEAKVIVRLCQEDLGGENISELVYPILGGQYIPDYKIALMNSPKRIIRLEDSPQTSKLLEVLCKKNISKSDLFESVWGYKYSESLHNGHIRNMLSKLRKKFSENIVVSEKNIITLKK
jgi:tetratricopeptide (TPR) repeat protein